MTEDEIQETLHLLRKDHDFFQVYHITQFEGYRKNKAGLDQKVKVTILDAGTEVKPGMRYHCVVTAGGKTASGSPAESIHTVLALVRWWDLDK